ncbi:HK97 gp10 family phage protein [Ruminococcaceae bacterium OttesenSCG-928-I18]|nr:HK97 gp10 family phage protein [Ruminococcaceae bacterium OttesenSCG-928-I18]
MADRTVGPDGFAAAIGSILQEYGSDVVDGTKVLTDKVAKKTVSTLKKTSPVGPGKRGKRYRTRWTSTEQISSVFGKVVAVHNTKAGLTHLTEHGHQLRQGGRTRAIPHIAPAEKQAVQEFEEGLEKVIQNG